MDFIDTPASGEVSANAYMVERGKPAAMIPIHERDTDNAIKMVEETFKLNAYIEDLSEGWKKLWIYKYDHVLQIINALPQAPQTVIDHWILGKLFGYEESAIHDFVSSKFS